MSSTVRPRVLVVSGLLGAGALLGCGDDGGDTGAGTTVAAGDADGFVEVARSDDGDVAATLDEAGVYRAEVRMVPLHLREDFRSDAGFILRDGADFVWIYGGTFTVN